MLELLESCNDKALLSLKMLKAKGYPLVPVGSRYTCNPAPLNTDIDYLTKGGDELTVRLMSEGWKEGGSCQAIGLKTHGKPFTPFRLGDYNLIVAHNYEEFRSFCLATNVCKMLNVLDKRNRIVVFEAVMYKNDTTEELPWYRVLNTFPNTHNKGHNE